MSHLSDKRFALMGLEFVMDTLYRDEMEKLQKELRETKHRLNTAEQLLKIREDQHEVAEEHKDFFLLILQSLLVHEIILMIFSMQVHRVVFWATAFGIGSVIFLRRNN